MDSWGTELRTVVGVDTQGKVFPSPALLLKCASEGNEGLFAEDPRK